MQIMGLRVFLLVILIVMMMLINFIKAKDYSLSPRPSPSKLGIYNTAAVATESAACAPIGKEILLKGGSAIDAAISLLLCVGLVDPEASGLGGGFHMVYYNKEENSAYHIDAREVAPLKATKEMFGSNKTASKIGGLSIAVPGALAGYEVVHRRFGKLNWRELFLPVIKLAREGFKVDSFLAYSLNLEANNIKKFDNLRKLFTNPKTGKIFIEGDTMCRPDLARTLEIIAKQGKRALYGPSSLAKEFLIDLKNAGSIIDRIDMMTYLPKIRKPIKISLRNNLTLYTSNMPTGGPLISLILNIMDGYPYLNSGVANSRERMVTTLHRLLEAFKFAFANRRFFEEDDSEEMEEFVKDLTSKAFADEVRSLIGDKRTYQGDPSVVINEDHGTSHISVLAPDGDVVTVTQSINLSFGSKVLSPSTGIILNCEMDDFNAPNITNYYGIPPGDKNFIQPGKRPLSSMSPTIIFDSKHNLRLVTGGSGGTRIPTNVVQVILKNVWLEKNIKEAIDGPRFHYQYRPDIVEAEETFDKNILKDLKSLGHIISDHPLEIQGHVNGIAKGYGQITANADYRTKGDVAGF